MAVGQSGSCAVSGPLGSRDFPDLKSDAMTQYHFEDFTIGQAFTFEVPPVTKEQIIEFASTWDPQPLHLGEAAAGRLYDGVIASGIHTLAAALRPMIVNVIAKSANLGGPGMEQIRWPVPVRPGDRLTTSVTVASVHPSRTKPDRGLVTFDVAVENQTSTTVMTMQFCVMLRKRPLAAVDNK